HLHVCLRLSSCASSFQRSAAPPSLPSSPTRRSSDLARALAARHADRLRLEPHLGGRRLDQGRLGDPVDLLLRHVADEDQGHVERSEEHTSELQSLTNLVCRLLLEKKQERTNLHMPRL